jgi:hypothetical protein
MEMRIISIRKRYLSLPPNMQVTSGIIEVFREASQLFGGLVIKVPLLF